MSSNQHYQNIDRKYLIKEVRKLKMELKQSKQVCQIHKNAVITLSQPHVSKNTVLQTLVNLVKSSNQSRRYQQMRKQIVQLEGQVMVLEKIVQQAVNSQKQTYNLLVDNFQKLKEDNIKKDDQLNKFYQKIGEVDYLSGLVTKYIEVLPPLEQTMAFQKQQIQLLDMLNLQKDTIRKITQQKDKLIKINVHLKDELDRKKDDIRNLTLIIDNNVNDTMILNELEGDRQNHVPTGNRSLINVNLNHSLMNNSINNPNNHSVISTLNFLKLQNQLIKEQNQGDGDSQNQNMDCPQLAVLFPDRVKLIKSTRQRKKVPYLNMLKVRQLMVKRQNKLKKQIEAANAHVNPTTKIIKLEQQLDITRKELSNYMLKYRQISQQSKNLHSFIEELESRNSIFLQSNERLTNIYKSLFEQYQFCRAVTAHVESITGRKFKGQSLQSITTSLDQYLNPVFKRGVNQKDENNVSSILLAISSAAPRKRAMSVGFRLP